ncbi:hypothetical protein J6590_068771 [Homalodisca vitripennis]|nr:hypothetical protein J6590_068771 [Homalodisca vitripennis]
MYGSRASGCDVICTKPVCRPHYKQLTALERCVCAGRSVCVTSSARRATAHPPLQGQDNRRHDSLELCQEAGVGLYNY